MLTDIRFVRRIKDRDFIKRIHNKAVLKRLGMEHFGKESDGGYSAYEDRIYSKLSFIKRCCNTNDIEKLMHTMRKYTLPSWCGTSIGKNQDSLKKTLPELLLLKLIKDNGKKYELTALGQKKLKQYEKRQVAIRHMVKADMKARERLFRAATRKQPIGYG